MYCKASGYQLNEDDDDDGYDDYDYDKEVIYEQHHPGPTYQVSNQWPPIKHSIPCYTCHFIFQHDHQQGPMNCKDPFTSLGIPQVDCYGACAVSNTYIIGLLKWKELLMRFYSPIQYIDLFSSLSLSGTRSFRPICNLCRFNVFTIEILYGQQNAYKVSK